MNASIFLKSVGTALAAPALLLSLVACGGSSSPAAPGTDPTPDPDPVTPPAGPFVLTAANAHLAAAFALESLQDFFSLQSAMDDDAIIGILSGGKAAAQAEPELEAFRHAIALVAATTQGTGVRAASSASDWCRTSGEARFSETQLLFDKCLTVIDQEFWYYRLELDGVIDITHPPVEGYESSWRFTVDLSSDYAERDHWKDVSFATTVSGGYTRALNDSDRLLTDFDLSFTGEGAVGGVPYTAQWRYDDINYRITDLGSHHEIVVTGNLEGHGTGALAAFAPGGRFSIETSDYLREFWYATTALPYAGQRLRLAAANSKVDLDFADDGNLVVVRLNDAQITSYATKCGFTDWLMTGEGNDDCAAED
jgi:hypothetical protein